MEIEFEAVYGEDRSFAVVYAYFGHDFWPVFKIVFYIMDLKLWFAGLLLETTQHLWFISVFYIWHVQLNISMWINF